MTKPSCLVLRRPAMFTKQNDEGFLAYGMAGWLEFATRAEKFAGLYEEEE